MTNPRLFFKRNSSTILTCIAAVGVVATSIVAVKETPKALLLLDRAKEEKGEDLTKLEAVKVAGPVYIPAILIGVSTIVCIFGSNALNKNQQASLMSAYALIDNAYKEYRSKVKELLGEETDVRVMNEIAKDKYSEEDVPVDDQVEMFFDMFSMTYFYSTTEDVHEADRRINKLYKERGYVSLCEYYDILGLPNLDFARELGWSKRAAYNSYGYDGIDFEYDVAELDDGLVINTISMPFEPTMDYMF